MTHDFYEILQVHPRAEQEAIQIAYERLSARYDPARLEGMAEELIETARQRRALLEEAFATLNNPERRAAYDARGQGSGVRGQESMGDRGSGEVGAWESGGQQRADSRGQAADRGSGKVGEWASGGHEPAASSQQPAASRHYTSDRETGRQQTLNQESGRQQTADTRPQTKRPTDQATTDALLDYRPLPSAGRQERPRHFNAQPQQLQGHIPSSSRRTGLIVATVLIIAVLGISLSLSGGMSQLLPTSAQATAVATVTGPIGFDLYETAISQGREATQQNPNDVVAWVTYANALYDSVQIVRENEPNSELYKQRLPRWLEASQAYSQALKLQGDNPNPLVLSDRGASLCFYGAGIADQKYVTQGLSDTRTAATAAPNEALILFNYGNCLISIDPPQIAEANVQWQRILEVTPADSPIAARARELLTQYKP